LSGSSATAGAVLLEGNVYIQGSTISGNSAPYIGGVAIDGNLATATIVGSTVSRNVTGYGAGGIYSNVVRLTLANSTVAFNASRSDFASTGGIRLFNTTLSAQSSIIADNSRPGGRSECWRAVSTACAISSASGVTQSWTAITLM
jgi:hypothetical protein